MAKMKLDNTKWAVPLCLTSFETLSPLSQG